MELTKKLGLYIHIPFCESKCSYCDFYSITDISKKSIFIKTIISHIKEYNLDGYLIDTIYFGGGTPSLLPEIVTILKEIKKRFNISKYVEITAECNPESMNKKTLKAFKKAGVNRLSIGMQSTNDQELRWLGRIHNFDKAHESFKLARDLGFNNISIDLIYGLKNQMPGSFMSSLNEIIKLDPEHISVYGLKLEEGTRLFTENPVLPSDDVQADLYLEINKRLTDFGYEHYEISNFAKPGYDSMHNKKYWNLDEYLGFGPSAHSFFSGRRFSFINDLDKYINGIKNNENITNEIDYSDIRDRHGEYIMLKLRTNDGINDSEFMNLFARSFDEYAKRFDKYIKNDYAIYDNGTYKLTPKGFLISNTIISDILG